MDKSSVRVSDLTEQYLNAHYYARRFLENEECLAACGIPRRAIGEIASKCNCGATPVDVVYDGGGQGLIRTSDVRPNRLECAKVLRTKSLNVSRGGTTAAVADDLIFTMSGTIGNSAVVPETDEVFSFSNTIARVRLPANDENDPRYISAFFSSSYGRTQSLRLTSGGIQGHVMPNPFKRLLVPTPSRLAQKYIGDKVRQAERFRRLSGELSDYALRLVDAFLEGGDRASEIERAAKSSVRSQRLPNCFGHNERSLPIAHACQATPTWRVANKLLTARLDCNFYAKDGMEIERHLSKHFQLAALEDVVDTTRTITNGVRGPDLEASPFKLVRLQDRDGWSIDFDRCLTISRSQFQENRRCELHEGDVVVAVGGYIGSAAVVRRVEPAVIGQHSAVLPMGPGSQIDEGYLVAYLSSRAGTVQLQRYVSGTVQAGINLEDLRGIRVPVPSTELQQRVGDAVRQADDLNFLSKRLCAAACRLVEALVEGRVSEADLVDAQRALDSGETGPDRTILSRLTEEGIDVAGKASLFADLEALYAALEEAKRADSTNGGAA